MSMTRFCHVHIAAYTGLQCPRCDIERRLAEARPASRPCIPTPSPQADTVPDKTPEEAVIEAAERWLVESAAYEPACSAKLRAAVRALHASRQPKGVRPEECELGTLFHFQAHDSPEVMGRIWRLVSVEGDATLFFMEPRGRSMLCRFSPEDRIIPLKDA